jgi:hypothetical protein
MMREVLVTALLTLRDLDIAPETYHNFIFQGTIFPEKQNCKFERQSHN